MTQAEKIAQAFPNRTPTGRIKKEKKVEKVLKAKELKPRPKTVILPGRIDTEKALGLRMKGVSNVDIAKAFGVSHQAVSLRFKRLSELLNDKDALDRYEKNKTVLLSGVERELLENILDPEKLKAASINNIAYAFQQVFQANRLTKGMSTENISYKEINKDIIALEQEIADYTSTLPVISES